MKEKLLNFTFCLCCFGSIFFIFKNNKEVAKVIMEALNLFVSKVFVSLFPMFVINNILINLNIPYYFYKIFNKLFLKVFHVRGVGAYVFVMSLISGTPSNAYILKELESDGAITKEEANHLLAFTYFSNPLFLTLMLKMIFDSFTTLKIILIHYITNIILGILLRKKALNLPKAGLFLKRNEKMSLNKSITKSINTLLMILGTIVFYMLVIYIVTNIVNINPLGKTLIAGFLEITNGLNNLALLKISVKLKEIIAIFIICFGGLSIHSQIKAILEDTKIDYKYFLKGRVMHAFVGIILIIIF